MNCYNAEHFKAKFDKSALLLMGLNILLNGMAMFVVTFIPFSDLEIEIKIFVFMLILIIPILLTALGFWTGFQELIGYISIPNQREMTREERAYLMPCVQNVITKINEVHNMNLDINDYVFKIFADNSINAFALGNRNIYVSEGLLYGNFVTDRELEGILAHEFAHLIKKDTVFISAIVSCNFILRVMGYISGFIVKCSKRSRGGDREGGIFGLAALIFHIVFVKVLSDGIFKFVLRFKGRTEEYRCDAFAASLGYDDEMISFFRKLDRLEFRSNINFIQELYATHPRTSDRIIALQNLE